MKDYLESILEATEFIKEKIEKIPDVAIILGSGLGKIAEVIENPVEIKYCDIPNFPSSSVVGHANQLIIGTIGNKCVMAMQGRFHYYEGYDMSQVVFPIRVFAKLGIRTLIVSNAAGGIDENFQVGDLMLITDHINLSGNSPLRGKNYEEFGERFPSMTNAYSLRLRNLAKEIIETENVLKENSLREGVYAFMPGPQYETKAEIKMLSVLGASACGMSTVPEVICAVHSGMEVLGISCITNLCFTNEVPNHKEVIEASKKVEESFKNFVIEMVERM